MDLRMLLDIAIIAESAIIIYELLKIRAMF